LTGIPNHILRAFLHLIGEPIYRSLTLLAPCLRLLRELTPELLALSGGEEIR
jgi:hypothetical protein